MKYKGIELKEFTSDKSVVFDPPKKMFIWDALDCVVHELEVYAYLPQRYASVQCAEFQCGHCAEIPEARCATNRELVMWLAQGNGMFNHKLSSTVQTSVVCDKTALDKECNPNWRVCKWEDSDWYEPTVDYMGLE